MARRYKKLENGNYVREVLYSCPEPRDTTTVRAARSKATSKAQQRVNQNNSKVKLAMLIGGNFGPGDLFVTPTFSPEHLPATYAEFQRKVQKFYDLLRTARQNHGVPLQYVYAPHHEEKVRWHLHSIINTTGPEDWELIKSLWPWGNVHIKRMGETKYSTPDAMAGYLIEGWTDRPNSARAWCASTNLKKTTVTTYREHNPAARLELPVNCNFSESDSWATPYGEYEYLSYFRPDRAYPDHNQETDTSQPESRELIDKGAL